MSDIHPRHLPRHHPLHEDAYPDGEPEAHRLIGPRGWWLQGKLYNLTPAEESLCTRAGVPLGYRWDTLAAWLEDRRRILLGAAQITPTEAACYVGRVLGMHCEWDEERKEFRAWRLGSWEHEAHALSQFVKWVERVKESDNVNGSEASGDNGQAQGRDDNRGAASEGDAGQAGASGGAVD